MIFNLLSLRIDNVEANLIEDNLMEKAIHQFIDENIELNDELKENI